MRRLLLVSLVLVAACSDPGRDLSPEEAYADADTAAESGDVRRALSLFESAAERGHLGAMKALVSAHQNGYVRTRANDRFVPFLPLPWEGSRAEARWRETHERALREGIRDGNEEVMLAAAEHLRYHGSRSHAELDSAEVILDRLLAESYPPAQMFVGANLWGADPDRADSLLAQASAGGNAQACHLRLYRSHPRPHTVSQVIAYVEDAERCPPLLPGGPSPGEEILLRLGAIDTPHFHAVMDSLGRTDLFDRYPHLPQ